MSAAALLASIALAASTGPVRYFELDEDGIGAHLASVHAEGLPLAARVERISEAFLGTPYVLGPLGEGESGEFDRDPLWSFKRADCTTFVEQVMAMSVSSDMARAKDTLRLIRYKDGEVGYASRNHFAELDWLPNNAKAGYLKDITRKVAGRDTKWVFKTISKRQWYLAKSTADLAGFADEPEAERAARVERWRAKGERMKDQNARLAYVALEDLARFGPSIPSGTVASVLRESLPEKPLIVTHQGLVIQKREGTFFRHAAFGKRVEDVPLLEYAARFKDAKWRVIGLNLAAPVQPK